MSTRARALGLRARLMGLMALVLLPMLLGSVLFASRAYRQNLAAIAAAREQIVHDFSVRSRIWFRGASRTLLAAVTTATGGGEAAACGARLMEAMRPNIGYRAILALHPPAAPCIASLEPDITADDLAALAKLTAARPALTQLSGAAFAPVRYGAWTRNGRSFLVIHVSVNDVAGNNTSQPGHMEASALLLADPQVIDATFEIGPLAGATIGLVSSSGDLLAQRGTLDGNQAWLPAGLPQAGAYTAFDGQGRDGEDAPFAYLRIVDSPLGIIARFSRQPEAEAWQHYLIMAGAPLVVGLFLFLVYAVAVQRDVLRWIAGIKHAARARIDDAMSGTLAPVSDDMPRELRSVASAFNTMVRDSHAREAALTRSLTENRFLMRELHHRVKNSLQVIQSYLSLSRREAGRARRGDLAETEARVLVLSIAYRLALTEDGMRPVPLRPLAEEVVTHLTSTFRAEEQWVSLRADIDAALEVDRAIPFGLAIVEGVIAALRSPTCESVHVTITADGEGRLHLAIGAGPGLKRPNTRILQGLALQLQAEAQPPGASDVMIWSFPV